MMRVAALSIALGLVACHGALAVSRFGDDAPSLTLPDGSVLPLPPGSRAFGPGGPVTPPATGPAAPAEVAPAPAPPKDAAAARRQHLDDLYARLATAKDAVEAHAISDRIDEALLRSGSDTADLLMTRAVTAMAAKDNADAAALLDKIVLLRPRWAEAWNRRATLRYLEDDDVGAMADIGRVLEIEPRHVGALSGMGLILHRNGDDKGALTVLRRALALDPQDNSLKTLVDQVRPAVEGQDL